jgi:hypothetical protein
VGRRQPHVGTRRLLRGTPVMLEQAILHPTFERWKMRHPREWWAFTLLDESDSLRERVVAAVLSGRESKDEAIDELVRIGEAIERHEKALQRGCFEPPPLPNERRAITILIKRMTKVETEGSVAFRVDFDTPKGWSGYFDTTAPEVVERISKHRRRNEPLTIVGEVETRLFDFLVVIGGRVKIV